jgi:ParB family transcriptional regulator, chromosome partitioning protein
MKRAALGKGIAALIPEMPSARPSGALELPVADIRPNPMQPRRVFSEARLEELAASIRATGLLQPVVVSRAEGSGYILIAGERRWRAAQRAGLDRIPAVVRESVGGNDNLLALALIENVQREDLTPIEEARAYQQLRSELGLAQEAIASQVGKDRSTIANALRLLHLPLEVQALVDCGDLSAGHARALAGLDDEKRQTNLANRAVHEGWSVRELERRLKAAAPRPRRTVDPDTAAAADRLSLTLGAQVTIKRARRGGEIRVRFTSEEELIRLFQALAQEGQ